MNHRLLAPVPEVRTEHLCLRPVTPADVDQVFAVYSDALTWAHLPAARHTRRAQTEHLVQREIGSRVRHGVGRWAIRIAGTDDVVGVGGVRMEDFGVWSLGCCLAPQAWGRGYATETARAALSVASGLAPDAPVTAAILTHEERSAAVLRRVGLTARWQGKARETSPAGVELQLWADRALDSDALERLIAESCVAES